jgi:glycerol-3-phosphate acyltransferase PlsX
MKKCLMQNPKQNDRFCIRYFYIYLLYLISIFLLIFILMSSRINAVALGGRKMSDITRVALDAMGGDNAPGEIIRGAVEAVKQRGDIKVLLTGQEALLKKTLSEYTYPKDQIEVVNAAEVIETAEAPVMAIRRKKDSSLVVAMNLVKNGEADAFVSAGSSGAILVGGQVLVGRIKGVERPPLAPLIPTAKGVSLLIDCGANVDARPSHLVQFAKIGSIYMESVLGKKKPTVGIVNIGAEEEKGNALVKETFPLLKECKDINFIGSVEARDIPLGDVDVIVCEAFVGNVILKLYEGLGSTLISKIKGGMMTSLRSKIGALLVKPALKATLKNFDASEHGGAPLLGLNGLVVKTHGSSTSKEVCNSIIQCVTFKKQQINEKIKAAIQAQEEKKED